MTLDRDIDATPNRVVVSVSGVGLFELNGSVAAHGIAVPGGYLVGTLRGVHLAEGIAFATIRTEQCPRTVVPFSAVTPYDEDNEAWPG